MFKESHVYILEDNNSERKRMNSLLCMAGFNVHSFSDLTYFLYNLKPNVPVFDVSKK